MLVNVGDIVKMRKAHPCGSDEWTLTRVGADIKMVCKGCGRLVMLDRQDFEKRVKKLVFRAEVTPDGEEGT